MIAEVEWHHLIILIRHFRSDGQGSLIQFIRIREREMKRILLQGFFTVRKLHDCLCISMLNACEIGMACKAMVAHFVFFSAKMDLFVPRASDHRKQSRIPLGPECRISLPHVLEAAVRSPETVNFRDVLRDAYRCKFILQFKCAHSSSVSVWMICSTPA